MKFFVSYASKDKKWAEWVVWELENSQQRHKCIVQFRDFVPGMSFMRKMRQASQADSTIALFSPSYFKSEYCQQELDAALVGNTNRLLPIRVSPCDPGAFLRDRIYIDLCDDAVEDIGQLRELLLIGVEAYVSQTYKNKGALHQRPTPPRDFSVQPPPRREASKTDTADAQQVSAGPLQILFIAPTVGGLSPKKQLRAMQKAVNQLKNRPTVHFEGVFDARVSTLFTQLNRRVPDVFHFSGKQNGGDVLMRTDEGGLISVSDRALAGIFKSLDHGPKLVIIDTCYSLRCATTIAKVVPCAVGVEGDIEEDDAITFYSTFYQALAAGNSLKDATAQAQNALKLNNAAPEHIPQLRCRTGVDSSRIFFVYRP